jgi:hypothetical protein
MLQRSLGIRDRTIKIMHVNWFSVAHFVLTVHDDITPINAKVGDEKL